MMQGLRPVAEQDLGMGTALRQRVLTFTGLIPVILMVPVLAFNLYALAIGLGSPAARQ